jgi:hypothetical protein
MHYFYEMAAVFLLLLNFPKLFVFTFPNKIFIIVNFVGYILFIIFKIKKTSNRSLHIFSKYILLKYLVAVYCINFFAFITVPNFIEIFYPILATFLFHYGKRNYKSSCQVLILIILKNLSNLFVFYFFSRLSDRIFNLTLKFGFTKAWC